jgi:hypothetical protein
VGHQQDLREQGLQLFEEPPAEGGDGVCPFGKAA